MRLFPAASASGVFQVFAAFHVIVAEVAAPLSLTSASGVLRDAPVALFQCVFAFTPALSVAAIGVALSPTKLMLTAVGVGGGAAGTICTAFTGARRVVVEAVPGMAVMVKPVAVTVNFT